MATSRSSSVSFKAFICFLDFLDPRLKEYRVPIEVARKSHRTEMMVFMMQYS
jgi:hypothetical protein